MAKWEKGESGNPKGRPHGSKNKLVTDFINALAADFDQHGEDAIRAMREKDPGNYVKAVVQLVPKDFRVERTLLDDIADMSQEEIDAKLHELEREKFTAMSAVEFEEHIAQLLARLYQYRGVDAAQSKAAGLH